MPTIFFTTEDPAGSSIAMNLVYEHGFVEKPELLKEGTKYKNWFGPGNLSLVELQGHLYEAEYLQHLFPAGDLWVFASRHVSDARIAAFTVHSTGNWGSRASVGGQPQQLGMTSAKAMKAAFSFFQANPLPGFEVTLEATHHGPTTLTTPSLWVELGSTPEQWKNPKAADVVARAILYTCQNYPKQKGIVALGFGGTHYASNFNKLQGKEHAFSHIAPKHALDSLDAALIKQAMDKTHEKVQLALVDWKGCTGQQRQRVLTALETAGLKWEKV